MLSEGEDAFERSERHLDETEVGEGDDGAQLFDAALIDDETDLVEGSSRRRVADGPDGLAARLEVRRASDLDQSW